MASNEEGNLYVDITELRMDQVILLISPVLLRFDAWAISYQWQIWIKMLTIQFSFKSCLFVFKLDLLLE